VTIEILDDKMNNKLNFEGKYKRSIKVDNLKIDIMGNVIKFILKCR